MSFAISCAQHVHVKSSRVVIDPDVVRLYRLVWPCKNDMAIYVLSQMFNSISNLANSLVRLPQYSSRVFTQVNIHMYFRLAVGCFSFSSDTSKTTHVTLLLQLRSLYRRNNGSSELCSAIPLVVPVALEHETPGSRGGSHAHTTSCGCMTVCWSPKETVFKCCSYGYPSSMQASTRVQVESNTSLVLVCGCQ